MVLINAPAKSFIPLAIKDLLLGAECLRLRNLQGGYKSVIPFMDQQGSNLVDCLKALIIYECTMLTSLHAIHAPNSRATGEANSRRM